MRKAAALGVVAMLAMTSPARSQPAVGSFFIRASAGLASEAMDDWEDDIFLHEDIIRLPGYFPAQFDDFGGVAPFGVEAGYQLRPSLSLALAVFRQIDSVTNPYTNSWGSGWLYNEANMTSVTASATYWMPRAHGLFFGGDMGIGFGSVRRETRLDPVSVGQPPPPEYITTWEGTGDALIGGLFFGIQGIQARRFLYDARLGYQFQNLGVFDGTYTTPSGSGEGPYENVNGPVETDFSGWQFLVGFGMAFGGR